MIATACTDLGRSVATDQEFQDCFYALRAKLRAAGADIVAVKHTNYWVDVDWLPKGSDPHTEPVRSTIFRLFCDSDDNAPVWSQDAVITSTHMSRLAA